MYMGALCILTIMVTYSRYITSLVDKGDHARIAKFEVITSRESCPEDDDSCFDDTKGSIRPADTVSFYYSVDTTNLEVSTKLVTTLIIDEKNSRSESRFKQPRVYEVTDNGEVEVTLNSFDFNTTNRVSATEDIAASQGRKKTYKLVMDYDYAKDYTQELTYEDILKISYSATQK